MMASLHVITEPTFDLKKSIGALIPSVSRAKEPKEKVVASKLRSKKARGELVRVLERAADDDVFIAQLTYEGSKALEGYDLTSEEKAALLSGDIQWIEAHLGKLDERLSTWLWCRLQQEIW
jgi:hypothetical protein